MPIPGSGNNSIEKRTLIKTAVIYFSLEGNTKYAAELIGKTLGADLIPLIPAKAYPTGNFAKYFWAGKSATFRERPKLKPFSFDPDKYDLVILGTPIWAGTFASPLRTFIRRNKLTGKKIALFASCAGGPAEKCFAQLEKKLPGCTLLSTLRLVDPLKGDKQELDESIAGFCAKLAAPTPSPA